MQLLLMHAGDPLALGIVLRQHLLMTAWPLQAASPSYHGAPVGVHCFSAGGSKGPGRWSTVKLAGADDKRGTLAIWVHAAALAVAEEVLMAGCTEAGVEHHLRQGPAPKYMAVTISTRAMTIGDAARACVVQRKWDQASSLAYQVMMALH